MDSIIDTLRWLLMWIDFAVYTMIEKIYYLFLMLSEATVLNDEIITNFTSKVYVLISLIMLFRLAFSFINYIVNPDTITDKQKGGGKLITNIVISIALLVSIPTIFHELYYLQGVIVQQNVIEKLVLGESTITENGEDSQITAANYLSLYAFTSFFTPNQAIPGCAEPFTVSNGVRTLTSSCLSALDQASTKDKNVGTNYNNALTSADLMYIAQGGMADEKAAVTNSQYVIEKEYLFDYSYIISTIFGLALCFVLIGFCFDLAIRIIKLGFLQLIAPIPIVLNMAPANKNNYLGNFGKEVVSTWVSLFIRIAVVTFAIYFIQLVYMSGVTSFVSGEVVSNPFVNAFVMMGLLMFAKEFPKLLEELLGLKGAGKLTLNPIKAIRDNPLAAGAVGGLLGGAVGSVATAGRKIGASLSEGKGLGRSIMSGAGGLLTGAVGGIRSGAFTAEGRKNGFKAGLSTSSRAAEKIHRYGDTTFGERLDARTRRIFGMTSLEDTTKAEINALDGFSSQADSILKRANSEMIKQTYNFTDSNHATISIDDFKSKKEELNLLRNMDTSGMTDAQREAHSKNISDMQTYISKTEKLAEQAYVDNVIGGTITDNEMSAQLKYLRDIQNASSNTTIRGANLTTGAGIKTAKDNASSSKTITENSMEYKRQQAVSKAINSGNKK